MQAAAASLQRGLVATGALPPGRCHRALPPGVATGRPPVARSVPCGAGPTPPVRSPPQRPSTHPPHSIPPRCLHQIAAANPSLPSPHPHLQIQRFPPTSLAHKAEYPGRKSSPGASLDDGGLWGSRGRGSCHPRTDAIERSAPTSATRVTVSRRGIMSSFQPSFGSQQPDALPKQADIAGTASTLPHLHWMCYSGAMHRTETARLRRGAGGGQGGDASRPSCGEPRGPAAIPPHTGCVTTAACCTLPAARCRLSPSCCLLLACSLLACCLPLAAATHFTCPPRLLQAMWRVPGRVWSKGATCMSS